MTTTTPATAMARPVAAPTAGLRWAVSDALAITRRNVIHLTRQPQLLVFSTIQPVMFVLLFNYVFGGSIGGSLPGGLYDRYIDFLLPGIFVQTVAFGSTQTAVGLAEDLAGGAIDRFRSLPMARSGVLAGRTIGDLVRNLFVVVLMLLVGSLIGFRFTTNPVAAVGAVLVVVGLGFALSWIFAFVGLSVPGSEAAQAASFVAIFPLVFASSIFTPIEGMPGWLQAFVKANPITNVANAARALCRGGPTFRPVLYSVLWIVGILAVFVPLAVNRYRRMT